jgi:hypothetical protein
VSHHVVASIDGRAWVVRAGKRSTHVRNLNDAAPAARELIADQLGVPADSVDVDVGIELPAPVVAHLNRARDHAELAVAHHRDAADARRAAARALRDAGLTVREVGAALGVSHQRAQQLITSQ